MVAEPLKTQPAAFLPSDLAAALDPVRLARRAGVELDDWQQTVLRGRHRQSILCCSRQSGKSLVAALAAVHTALYEPEAPVLLLSPSLRQSQELFRRCLTLYQLLGRPVKPEAENSLSLLLSNGSRILSLPGKEGSIRGFSKVRRLIIDEAARVEDSLYQAVRPMVAVSQGSVMLLSTPFGKRGFFWHEYENGGDDWHRSYVPATACPRIPKDWLERERASIGDFWYNQEYACLFLDSLTQVFSTEDVLAAVDPDVLPLFEGGRL